jgi:hypothetical protein
MTFVNDLDTLPTKAYLLFGSFIAWSVLFIVINYNVHFQKLSKKENDDIKNRMVSTLHGLYTFFAIGYHFYKDKPEYGSPNTPLQQIIILTSGGYVIYDTLACLYYGLFDMGLVIHHGMVLFGYWACQYYGYSTEGLIGLFYAEASNAPMHFRMMLKQVRLRYTALYELLEILYIAIYFVFRGFFATILFVKTWGTAVCPFAVKLTCSGIWLQSMVYIKEMVGIIKRKRSQFKEKKEKGIEYWWLSENPRLVELSFYKKESRDKIF